jgi:sec-independent protein translocase protein TatA
MAHIGFSELVVILMILVLVFGASRLPKLGESLGKAVRNVKRGVMDNDSVGTTAVKKQIAEPSASKPQGNVQDAELVEDTSREPKA